MWLLFEPQHRVPVELDLEVLWPLDRVLLFPMSEARRHQERVKEGGFGRLKEAAQLAEVLVRFSALEIEPLELG